MNDRSLQPFRSRFPLLDERLYFASQCLGPMPAEVMEDLEDYRRSLALRSRAIFPWVERMNEVIGLVEALLGAPPGSVALLESATAAQAAVAAALTPTAAKRGIVIAEHDFHSSRFLWRAQERRGFVVEQLAAREDGELSIEQYVAAVGDETAVVATALVSPRTGALLDAAPVIRAAHEHEAIVVLDAYQAVGVVPIDVQALDADVVIGGTHKWLGGGDTGLAFMYVRPSLANRLEPAYPGWVGHATLGAFDLEYEPANGARRFQQGMPAMAPIYTARAGLRCALEIGVTNIRARNLELTTRMLERADARGLRTRTPRHPRARGGMICFDVPEGPAVVEALARSGIDVDFRPGAGVRVGPHACHREDECERVVDAIAEARRS